MRLTLRTLLAWLDDTLSPSEVRQIGKQVAESPLAKELVDKIHKVTRQRRLTVPGRTGADGVDPNLVAAYLDNELDPELVAEFEKRCLTSDVHLAEVASVHQILSLIGQKAKVPVEARHRMYQLIKGREAVRPTAPRASRQTEPGPVSEPVQPWVTPPPPRRPWFEQYGPAAAVVGLILVLCWSAWMSLRPSEPSSRFAIPLAAANPDLAKHAPAPRANPKGRGEADATAKADEAKAEGGAAAKGEQAGAAKGKGADGESPKEGEKEKAEAKTAAVPGSVGLARKPSGVLLRYNPDQREWVRVADAAPLREQDRLLSLNPFRSTVEIGSAEVDLVREAEVWVHATPSNRASRLNLARGRVVLHGTAPSLPFEVTLGDRSVTVTPPPGGVVGVERVSRRAPGEPKASDPALRLYAVDGPVKVSAGGHDEELDSSGAVTVEPDGTFSEKGTKPTPEWVTEKEPPPFDQKVGEQFLKFFRADRPIVSGLVEASEDEQKDVCRLAIAALRAVGDISYIIPLLNKKGDPTAPTARRAAIAVLRGFLAQGPDAAKALREQLQRDLGDDLAATAEKLLVGYTPKEAGDEATYAKLVQILGTNDPNEVGLRELALDNLEQLTGRDDLDYDPEKPKGKGLDAWRGLLLHHELRPAARQER